MKTIVLEFDGGPWAGKCLRTDSADQEEVLMAAELYETSHHGAIGGDCAAVSADAMTYARFHGWPQPPVGARRGGQRYLVSERRETEDVLVIRLRHIPNVNPSSATAS